jgi:hypothetical protein
LQRRGGGAHVADHGRHHPQPTLRQAAAVRRLPFGVAGVRARPTPTTRRRGGYSIGIAFNFVTPLLYDKAIL